MLFCLGPPEFPLLIQRYMFETVTGRGSLFRPHQPSPIIIILFFCHNKKIARFKERQQVFFIKPNGVGDSSFSTEKFRNNFILSRLQGFTHMTPKQKPPSFHRKIPNFDRIYDEALFIILHEYT